MTELYDRIVDDKLLVRRIYVVANHVVPESSVSEDTAVQLDLFTDIEESERREEEQAEKLEREKNMQRAVLGIKKKYGKNAILKGMNFVEGATTVERNGQVGGHKA